jgi:type II secretory pathway predicted ATPase ExeA
MMTRAPLTVVTGEVGTGKTTLVQALLGQIETDVTVGLISNAQGGRGDLLRWVLSSLDLKHAPQLDYVRLFNQFHDIVVSEYAAGRHVLLIIDEAQNLESEVLEELRMLTNINSNKDELLQLILLGQPELQDKIAQPSLRQFAQRVSATYHLDPMDTLTTHQYIRHRLKHAGGTGEEFSPQAIQYIYYQSQGIPRVVNKLCDLALVYAASAEQKNVDIHTVEELIKDGIVVPVATPPFFLTNRTDESESNRL